MSRYHLYHRVSKAIQSEEGHGIDRQQQGSEIWIQNHNQKRVEEGLPSYSRGQVYEDRGRSGYTAANLKKGELGQLMNDIERGFIEKGDIIVIELIDRFSRAKPDFVRKQFEKILSAGVKIAITKWDIVFEEDMQGIEGVSARVLLEISIYLANQESSQKSARIRSSNKTMKDKGLKHIAKTPIWLARTYDRKGHEVIPQNAEIVQKIFELKLEHGWGALKIMNHLRALEAKGKLKGFVAVDNKPSLILARYTYNDEGELVQGALNAPLAESTVNAILRNRNVIGSLNDLPNYYPPIVDEAVYYAVQKTFDTSTGGGGSGQFNNIFRNIGVCGWSDELGHKCGYSLAYERRTGTKPPKGMYLKCNNKRKRHRCKAKNVNYFQAQNTVYAVLKEIKYEVGSSIDISALEAKRDEKIKQLDTVREYMVKFPSDPSWEKDYEELLAKEALITAEIENAKARVTGTLKDLNLDLSRSEDRFRFNQIMKDYKIRVVFCEKQVVIKIGVWHDFEIRIPHDYTERDVSKFVVNVKDNMKGVILRKGRIPSLILTSGKL